MSVFIIDKSLDTEIGYKLNHSEFKCKCKYETCHYTLINPKLVSTWDILRARWGKPLKINSGFRCVNHNIKVKGLSNSRHTMGQAIDIATKRFTGDEKFQIVVLAKELGFVVIEYENFIHCHIERSEECLKVY